MAKLTELSIGDLVVINNPNSRAYKKQGEVIWLLEAGVDYLNPSTKTLRPIVEVKVSVIEGEPTYTEWVNPKDLVLIFKR